MSFKNTDMEITKSAHKKDSRHRCDIRRSVAHNQDTNICERSLRENKSDKYKYVYNFNCIISQNVKKYTFNL